MPNAPSLRGKCTARDADWRLSPAILALRRDAQPERGSDGEGGGGSRLVPAHQTAGVARRSAGTTSRTTICRPPSATRLALECIQTYSLHCEMLREGTHEFRLEYIMGCFLTARRRESWELMNNTLHMARDLSLSMEETMSQMSIANERAGSPAPQSVMPDYIAEWFLSNTPCSCSIDLAGVTLSQHNEALIELWQTHSPAQDAETLMSISGVGKGRFEVDDAWNRILGGSEEDARAICETSYSLVAPLLTRPPSASCEDDAATPQHLEGECARLVHLNVDGTRVGPLRYRVRIVRRGKPESLEWWECSRFEAVCPGVDAQRFVELAYAAGGAAAAQVPTRAVGLVAEANPMAEVVSARPACLAHLPTTSPNSSGDAAWCAGSAAGARTPASACTLPPATAVHGISRPVCAQPLLPAPTAGHALGSTSAPAPPRIAPQAEPHAETSASASTAAAFATAAAGTHAHVRAPAQPPPVWMPADGRYGHGGAGGPTLADHVMEHLGADDAFLLDQLRGLVPVDQLLEIIRAARGM